MPASASALLSPAAAMTRFRTAVRALKASVLVGLVVRPPSYPCPTALLTRGAQGMYPAMVAAAVNLSGRLVRRTFCVDDVPSLLPDHAPAQSMRLSSLRSGVAQFSGVHVQSMEPIGAREAAAVEGTGQRKKEVAVKNEPLKMW